MLKYVPDITMFIDSIYVNVSVITSNKYGNRNVLLILLLVSHEETHHTPIIYNIQSLTKWLPAALLQWL